jgi:hypothetical protein
MRNKNMKRIILLIWTVLSFVQVNAQGQFTVEAPNVVATGERFRLVFTATNLEPESFNPPKIESFMVLAGPTTSTMNRLEYINGRRTQSRSISYTYILEAGTTGKFTIGEASVVSDKVTYRTQPVTVEVIQGTSSPAGTVQQQDPVTSTAISDQDVFLRLDVSKRRVMKGEPLTATLKLYTRVNVSGAEDIRFPTFNGFWSQEVYAPQQIDWQRENVNGEIYQVATLRRYVLLPQQAGSVKIDPSEIVCVIQVRNTRRGQSLLDDFFDSYQTVRKRVIAPAVTVNVSELPAGAPGTFKGAVGKFSINAEIGKDSVKTHDAVSVYVTVTGEGNINLLEAPRVTFPPDFEVYDAKITDNSRNTGGTFSGSKTFEYPVIPRSHGDFTIDPVEFSYYDIQNKQYRTIRSEPLKLKVERSTDLAAPGVPYTPGTHRRAVESLSRDIRYIKTAAPSWRSIGKYLTGSFLYFVILSLIFTVTAVVYVVLNKRREHLNDVIRVRNSKANKIARTRLKAAGVLLKQQLFEAYYEELHRALWGYISDKLGLSQAECSRERISELLQERNVEQELIKDFTDIIESCEYARYAPDPGQLEKERIFDMAVKAISNMEQALK